MLFEGARMTGSVGRNGVGLAATCFAALLAAGCGSNGNAGAVFESQDPPPTAFVTGVVYAPNGDLAAADSWWRWAQQLHLLPPAYAQGCAFANSVLPVDTTGVQVVLSSVSELDAADGQINDPTFLAQAFVDPDSGVYTIVNEAAANANECGLMVSAGGGLQLTRGWVFQRTTNIDAVSEAVVRVVLDRVAEAPAVQLCAFQSAGLKSIYVAAQQAACTVSGDTVFTLNQKVYEKVAADCCVQVAINAASGAPQPLSSRCALAHCPSS
jgi:hypothetical protein